MAAGQGGEGSPGESPLYSPYGENGRQVGESALKLLARLASPITEMPFAPGETQHWNDDDREAFRDFIDIEIGVQGFEADAEREGLDSDIDRRFPNIGRFHAALPFSDRERRWLPDHAFLWSLGNDAYQEAMEAVGMTAADDDTPIEIQIITLGEQQQIAGRDLVVRWATWRRDIDQYAGEGRLDEAHTALDLIGRQMLPNATRP